MAEYTENIGIKITVTGANEGATGINAVTEALNKLKNATTSLSSVTSATDKLSVSVTGLTSSFKALFSLAIIKKAINLIGSAVDKSNEYVENLNLFNTVMGDYTDEAMKYAEQVNSVMGIDVSQWIRYQGVFQSLAQGFGVASDRAYTMSKNLTQLGYDISALFNLDYDESMLKLQSGLAGEIEPMRRIGFDLSKARLEAIAAEKGITKSYKDMTQAEKAQLRYYAMLTQLPEVQGAMGREMPTLTTQIRILGQAVTEAGRAIGNMFVPFLQEVIPYVTAFVRVVRDAANWLANLFGFKVTEIDYSGLQTADEATDDLADDLDKATGRAKKLKKQLAGFDEINNLTTNTGTSGSGSDSSAGWIDFDLPSYDFLPEGLEDRIGEITEKIKEFSPIILGLLAGIAAYKVADFLINIPNYIEAISAALTALNANPVAAVIGLIAALVTWFITAYQTNDEFREKVNAAWEKIKETFTNVWNGIKTGWENFKNGFINGWNTIKDKVTTVAQWIKDKIIGARDAIVKAWNAGGKFFDGIKEGITNAFKTIVNAIIKGINKVISIPFNGINAFLLKLKSVDIFGLKPFNWINTLNVPQIPTLAEGGIVDKATLSVIGEAGKEAVVPLENNTGWINALATKINGASASNTDSLLEALLNAVENINVSPTITVKDIGEASVKYINQQSRLLGESVV